MTDGEIAALADRVLRPELEQRGLSKIVVREDLEDPDEPSLYIEAIFQPGSELVGGQLSSMMHHRLSRELLQAGEVRFPYFLVRHSEEEAAENQDL